MKGAVSGLARRDKQNDAIYYFKINIMPIVNESRPEDTF